MNTDDVLRLVRDYLMKGDDTARKLLADCFRDAGDEDTAARLTEESFEQCVIWGDDYSTRDALQRGYDPDDLISVYRFFTAIESRSFDEGVAEGLDSLSCRAGSHAELLEQLEGLAPEAEE